MWQRNCHDTQLITFQFWEQARPTEILVLKIIVN
jgi:hypothetical protein